MNYVAFEAILIPTDGSERKINPKLHPGSDAAYPATSAVK